MPVGAVQRLISWGCLTGSVAKHQRTESWASGSDGFVLLLSFVVDIRGQPDIECIARLLFEK